MTRHGLVSCELLVCHPLLVLSAGGEVDYNEHIAPLRAAAPPSMKCVLVSATLPQHTFDEVQELFVGLGAAFGPGLHRTAAGGLSRHAMSWHLPMMSDHG